MVKLGIKYYVIPKHLLKILINGFDSSKVSNSLVNDIKPLLNKLMVYIIIYMHMHNKSS